MFISITLFSSRSPEHRVQIGSSPWNGSRNISITLPLIELPDFTISIVERAVPVSSLYVVHWPSTVCAFVMKAVEIRMVVIVIEVAFVVLFFETLGRDL